MYIRERHYLLFLLLSTALLCCSAVKVSYKITEVAVESTYLAEKTVIKTSRMVFKISKLTLAQRCVSPGHAYLTPVHCCSET